MLKVIPKRKDVKTVVTAHAAANAAANAIAVLLEILDAPKKSIAAQ